MVMYMDLNKIFLILIIGIGAYAINLCCEYDMIGDKSLGRAKHMVQINKKRAILITVSLIFGIISAFLLGVYGYKNIELIRYCVLMAYLYPIAKEDAENRRIPNKWLIELCALRAAILIVGLLTHEIILRSELTNILSGGLISAALMFFIYVISRHAIGMGDVKLFAVIGIYLGIGRTYMVIFLASVLAALYGGYKLIRKKIDIKDEVAFAPFIALAVLIVIGVGF